LKDLAPRLLEMLFVSVMFLVPALTIWGWVRWTRSTATQTFSSTASSIAFCFSTASVALAVFTWLLAMAKGFVHYDPLLMTIYAIGLLLSVAGILFGILGVWRPNPLRWHAPLCALGMLIFWFIAAEGE